jgi:hypothetical protein
MSRFAQMLTVVLLLLPTVFLSVVLGYVYGHQ